jgi:hypothetical protein
LIYVQFQQFTSSDPGCGRFPVTFTWDGRPVTKKIPLDHCVAAASFRAPRDAPRGAHPVTAQDDKRVLLGRTYFFVTADPSAGPIPLPPRSASPTRSAGASGSVSPKPGRSSASVMDLPLATDTGPTTPGPALPQAAGEGTGAAAAPASGDGPPALGVALAFGGALMLGGMAILGMIVVRGRRTGSELALAESPTQPIPPYPATFRPPPPPPVGPPTRVDPPLTPPPAVPG